MWHVGGTADDETPSAPGGVDPSPVKPDTPADHRALAGSAVHITTMTDSYDCDREDLILDDVEDAVVTDANAVPVSLAC
jgi:hypothetical protein